MFVDSPLKGLSTACLTWERGERYISLQNSRTAISFCEEYNCIYIYSVHTEIVIFSLEIIIAPAFLRYKTFIRERD